MGLVAEEAEGLVAEESVGLVAEEAEGLGGLQLGRPTGPEIRGLKMQHTRSLVVGWQEKGGKAGD